MNRNIFITSVISLLIFIGCSKKPEVIPEEIFESEVLQTTEIKLQSVVEEKYISAVEEEKVETQVNESEKLDTEGVIEIEEVQVSEVPVNNSTEENLSQAMEVKEEVPTPQAAVNPQLDFDQIFPDSVWTNYMIKQGDYLSLIAYNEYGNANDWHRIYNWNRKTIGSNPNLIFPYHELDLKKPRESVVEWRYEHTIHTVVAGETLWTISKKEYGDEYAWIVLFWDNEKAIDQNDGVLYPGMKLKVRNELWPKL